METLNVHIDSEDWRARALANLAATSFILNGEVMESVEGFIQGIKFPYGDARRYFAFRSAGWEAKRCGKGADGDFAWWLGERIDYGSPAHHQLIERAIRAKFKQNLEAMRALVNTEGLTLIHETGHAESPTTSLPAAMFCDILTRIRQETLDAGT